ncbi:MAG TPA: PEPxxWA-CTERM sorting domain-containing protein [Rhizomicrobium sp.]|nr:PEPxxWA-CTERM sorting domain-containing protein [Rhizomicrobium sp.]
MGFHKFKIAAAVAAAMMAATSANADTIDWTHWTASGAGTASGATSGGVGVTFTGDIVSLVANYPSWTPTGTYVGGTVGNAPPQSGGIIQLFGGNRDVNTISFSTALVNPVIAIWSLGQGGIDASYNFINAPFTIEAGGPSAEYGGSSITSSGDTVFGVEGNGTIQFTGTYTSISFTNPVFEDWYGFTVGNDVTAGVPEPATWAMFLLGFGAIGWTLRGNRRKAAVTA